MGQYSQQLDELRRALARVVMSDLALLREQWSSLEKRIQSVNPILILRRGYVIVRRNGEIISSAKVLRASDTVDLDYHDGEVPAVIRERARRHP